MGNVWTDCASKVHLIEPISNTIIVIYGHLSSSLDPTIKDGPGSYIEGANHRSPQGRRGEGPLGISPLCPCMTLMCKKYNCLV